MGYIHAKLGLCFRKGLDPHGENVIYACADASLTVPRPQGCSIVMMNGCCMLFKTKKHVLTAASSCAAELDGILPVYRVRQGPPESGLDELGIHQTPSDLDVSGQRVSSQDREQQGKSWVLPPELWTFVRYPAETAVEDHRSGDGGEAYESHDGGYGDEGLTGVPVRACFATP